MQICLPGNHRINSLSGVAESDLLKSQTPHPLCASVLKSFLGRGNPPSPDGDRRRTELFAAPLRVSVAGRSPINHPAFMQRLNSLSTFNSYQFLSGYCLPFTVYCLLI
jgi:hypothetical protein